LYYFYLFLTYIFTGYIVFRSVKDSLSIEKFFNFYFLCIAVSSFIIIVQIIITSRIRSLGFIGYAIMDFSAITLTILILKYFIIGKSNIKIILFALLTLTVLITTLSRFAWIGFLFSLIYGIVITYRFDTSARQFLNNKKFIIILSSLFIIGLSIGFGVLNIIAERFSDVTFDFFEPTDEGQFIQNSLEARALIWLTAFNAFQASPITGIGYQMFSIVSEQYNILPSILFEEFVEGLDPHNTMLAYLSETGIVGFCSYMAFISTIFVYSFKAIKISANGTERANSIILNVIVFFMILNSIYSGQYTIGQQAFFMFIFFGLSVGNYVFLRSRIINNIKVEKNLL